MPYDFPAVPGPGSSQSLHQAKQSALNISYHVTVNLPIPLGDSFADGWHLSITLYTTNPLSDHHVSALDQDLVLSIPAFT